MKEYTIIFIKQLMYPVHRSFNKIHNKIHKRVRIIFDSFGVFLQQVIR